MKWILVFLMFLFSVSAVSQEKITSSDGNKVYYTGYLGTGTGHGEIFFAPNPKKMRSAPASYDLRKMGLVSKIKNQGSCGSCWSFGQTKSLESARLKAGMPELDLSEQQSVSCNRSAYGCQGGFMYSVDYLLNPGLALESNYPYTGTDSTCRNPLPPIADKIAKWSYIGGSSRAPTAEELKQAIMDYGVIFVTVAAGGNDWNGSRTRMTDCNNPQSNHIVNLVGWNEQNEFIIANSWGTGWGENGYAYARQGCNKLASEPMSAAFVTYAGSPGPTPPGPPTPVPSNTRLPVSITVSPGMEFPIGVKTVTGEKYQWYYNGNAINKVGMIWAKTTKNSIYKLVVTTSYGVTESTTEVIVR